MVVENISICVSINTMGVYGNTLKLHLYRSLRCKIFHIVSPKVFLFTCKCFTMLCIFLCFYNYNFYELCYTYFFILKIIIVKSSNTIYLYITDYYSI